jgi:hypothetical protein
MGEIAFDPFGTPCPVRRAQRQGVEGQLLSASNTGSPSGAVHGPRGRADNNKSTTFIKQQHQCRLPTQNGGTQLLIQGQSAETTRGKSQPGVPCASPSKVWVELIAEPPADWT